MPNIIVPNNGIILSNSTQALVTTAGQTIIVTSGEGTWMTVCPSYYTGTTATTTGSIYFTNNLTVTSTSTVPFFYNQYYNPSAFVPPKLKRGPLIKKSIRSSIKRAMKLIANFGMEEDLKVFLGGDSIEISHPESDFKFVLSKKRNMLLRATEHCGHHTPYNLSLYTKSDIHISDLCVYMDKTPILDQILAVSMFVKTGNEEELLTKANYNRLTSDIELRQQLALSNPLLQKKLRADHINI